MCDECWRLGEWDIDCIRCGVPPCDRCCYDKLGVNECLVRGVSLCDACYDCPRTHGHTECVNSRSVHRSESVRRLQNGHALDSYWENVDGTPQPKRDTRNADKQQRIASGQKTKTRR